MKLIIAILAATALVWIVYHFFPAVSNTAFIVSGIAITWSAILFACLCAFTVHVVHKKR